MSVLVLTDKIKDVIKSKKVIVSGRYRHYKGKEYIVLAVGRNSENPKEELIVYQAQYTDPKYGKNQIWIRPKKMFLEKVKVNGKLIPRFKLISKTI